MSISARIFTKMGQDKSHLRALATAIGVAPSTVTSWKVRDSDPPAKYIVPIATFLQVSPLWLLTGSDEPSADSAAGLVLTQEAASGSVRLSQSASTTVAPAAESSAAPSDADHRELITLFDSLDRPGRTIMLSVGYQEQRNRRSTLA